MHVVLVRPEIAANTGNIVRLAANAGVTLHLVEPLGFALDDRRLRRAGLDYGELAEVEVHPSLEAVRDGLGGRWFGCTASAVRTYTEVRFEPDDVLVFGAEHSGLGPNERATFEPTNLLRIPMRPKSRSLNLANAVAVVVYEAWRQVEFAGADVARGATTSETPGDASSGD